MYRPSLLPHWCFWLLSSLVTLWCQGDWVSDACSALEIPCSQPRLAHSGPSNCSACRPLPAQDTLPSSAHRPPQSGLPRGLLVPPAPLALNSQMLRPYLAWVFCLWFALENSTASQVPPSAASHKLMITAQLGPFVWLSFLSSPDECDVRHFWGLVSTLLDSSADVISYCLQYPFMAPSIPPLSQGFCSFLRCAPEILLQVAVDMLVFLPDPCNASLMDLEGNHTLT